MKAVAQPSIMVSVGLRISAGAASKNAAAQGGAFSEILMPGNGKISAAGQEKPQAGFILKAQTRLGHGPALVPAETSRTADWPTGRDWPTNLEQAAFGDAGPSVLNGRETPLPGMHGWSSGPDIPASAEAPENLPIQRVVSRDLPTPAADGADDSGEPGSISRSRTDPASPTPQGGPRDIPAAAATKVAAGEPDAISQPPGTPALPIQRGPRDIPAAAAAHASEAEEPGTIPRSRNDPTPPAQHGATRTAAASTRSTSELRDIQAALPRNQRAGMIHDSIREAAPAARVTEGQNFPAPAQQALTSTGAFVVGSIAGAPEWMAAAHQPAAPMAARVNAGGSPIKTLTVQLHPAELGMVTAKLRYDGDVLSIELQPDKAEAYHRLSTESDAILRAVRALGIEVEKVTIQQPQWQPLARGEASASAESGSGGNFSMPDGKREDAHRPARQFPGGNDGHEAEAGSPSGVQAGQPDAGGGVYI